MGRILVVSRDPAAAGAVGSAFPEHGLESADLLPGSPGGPAFEAAFVDVRQVLRLAPDGDAALAVAEGHRALPGARLVVIAAPDEVRDAVRCVREGAADYLTTPVHADEVQLVRENLLRRERVRSELDYLRGTLHPEDSLEHVRCRSDAMREVLHKVRQVAPTRSTVLLTGETGTGKSLLARIIHASSNRADRQLISLHCGAIPDTLLESELFGHERGAFTGAERRRLGKFEIADGGTLFLDEVATITPATQVKLLQVLQERSFQRVGGERTMTVDVRIVAATNADLEEITARGDFRPDLYYRLNVFPVEVPPLRARREDIPLLVETFLERLRISVGKDLRGVDPRVMEGFLAYPWPGNVRELENVLERAAILETTETLRPESFPYAILRAEPAVGPLPVDPSATLATVRDRVVSDAERQYLKQQLAAHHGRIDATAHAAGITPRQLHKLMRKHGLRKEDFRNP